MQIKNPGTGSSDDTVIRCHSVDMPQRQTSFSYGDNADTNAGKSNIAIAITR